MPTLEEALHQPAEYGEYVKYKTVEHVLVLALQDIDTVEYDKFHIVVRFLLNKVD